MYIIYLIINSAKNVHPGPEQAQARGIKEE